MTTVEVKSEKFTEIDSDQQPEKESLLQVCGPRTDISGGKGPLVGEDESFKDSADGLSSPPKIRRLTDIALELNGSKDTTCGIWCLKGALLQRCANKNVYVFLYGLAGSLETAAFTYMNGAITTLEKRFKIPTTNSGIILVGCDISILCTCLFLNYYAGNRNLPLWLAFGIYTVMVFSVMTALPHFIYGAGESALILTEEYGARHDANSTAFLVDKQNRELMCQSNSLGPKCDDSSGNLAPQVIMFVAQLISGVGMSVFYTLGVTYMDNNIQKSKTPALMSVSFFIRMLGPAMGYALASVCLSTYISPTLTPTIPSSDPRWLGAWWLGFLIMGVVLFLSATTLAMFPRSLPRAAARRIQVAELRKAGVDVDLEDSPQETQTSFKDMRKTYVRLLKNKTFMINNIASIFYFCGYMPYVVFMPKYIETIYKQTASVASFVTGAIGLIFSAIGILSAGVFISKAKPSARFLAAINVGVGAISVLGIISYAFLGCPVNDRQGAMLASGQMDTTTHCNADCHCDYVTYAPVCSPDGRTFISPCHAGCRDYRVYDNGTKVYMDCACVPESSHSQKMSSLVYNLSLDFHETLNTKGVPKDLGESWVLKEGLCPTDCSSQFIMFLVVMCILKFSGGAGRTSNFLVSIRCVREEDKSASMGLSLLLHMFAIVPSPILFGYLIDLTCLVWGKTCSGTGNCWLYNGYMLRYYVNFTAAGFLAAGTMFDYGVWYYVKNLKIFDEEVELKIAPQKQKTQIK